MMAKKKKRKKITVKLAQKLYGKKPTECYRIMDQLLSDKRDDLKKAEIKIGIAWRSGWRQNADGHLMLGKCEKRKDLDRELDEYDFIILLNEEVWEHLADRDKYRLIWHELLHAEICYDSDGSVLKDDKNRVVCRTRKHDIQEFREIVAEYGMDYDLNAEAKKALNDSLRPLFDQNKKKSRKKSMQQTVTETE